MATSTSRTSRISASTRLRARSSGLVGRAPIPITPEGKWFYADYAIDPSRTRLVCVREDHSGDGEAVTTLVSVPLDGGSAGDVIAAGYDFYSTPRFSPDGSRLCWIAWRHPNMPWDGTELWVADVTEVGRAANATPCRWWRGRIDLSARLGTGRSLYFASDPGWVVEVISFGSSRVVRTVRAFGSSRFSKNPPAEAEFGRPQWVFGTATWVFVGPSRMLAAYTQRGRWFLADVDSGDGRVAHGRHRSRAARLDGCRRQTRAAAIARSGFGALGHERRTAGRFVWMLGRSVRTG